MNPRMHRPLPRLYSRRRRTRWWAVPVLRGIALVAIAAIVLTTARQSGTPARLHSEMPRPPETEDSASLFVDRSQQYAWLSRQERKAYVPLALQIPDPAGFQRVKAGTGGFADWLRHLPAAPPGTPVKTAKNQIVRAGDDPRLAATVVLQPRGGKLLDASNIVVRLRAEFLWAAGLKDRLVFRFTSGHLAAWSDWAAGVRPFVQGRNVEFRQVEPPDDGRESFTCYLEVLFRYGTVYSLMQDTFPVTDGTIEPGDVFVRPGRPGHAVLVLDVAVSGDGRVSVLLGQGGTPPQTFHVLRDPSLGAWFPVNHADPIDLGPSGTFRLKDLRRWAN